MDQQTKILPQTEAFTFPSRIKDLDFETYKALRCLNSHSIPTILDRSPLHVITVDEEVSNAKQTGTLVHEMILEPEKKAYIIQPEGSVTTNAFKAELVEHLCAVLDVSVPEVKITKPPGAVLDAKIKILKGIMSLKGRYMVTKEQLETTKKIRESVMRNDSARLLIEGCETEQTMLWKDPISGCPCKSRVDAFDHSLPYLFDLKTARDASYKGFKRACEQYGYHYQAVFYGIGSKEVGLGERRMVYIVVENEPPYGVAIYEIIDSDALRHARERSKRAMELYAMCLEADHWPCYEEGVHEIVKFAPWAL